MARGGLTRPIQYAQAIFTRWHALLTASGGPGKLSCLLPGSLKCLRLGHHVLQREIKRRNSGSGRTQGKEQPRAAGDWGPRRQLASSTSAKGAVIFLSVPCFCEHDAFVVLARSRRYDRPRKYSYITRLECVSESMTPLGCKHSFSFLWHPLGASTSSTSALRCSRPSFLLARTSNQSQGCPGGLILLTAAQVLKFPPTGGAAVDRQPDEEPQELLHMVPGALHCVGVADPLM